MGLFNRTITLQKSDLLHKMSDFHCHLLPGVDDGIQKVEHTLAILEYYEEIGIRTVWFTPHVMEDIPNSTQRLTDRFEWLKQQYPGSIQLHLAAEYMMDSEYSERLEKKDLLTLGGENDQVLIETSTFSSPTNIDEVFERTKSMGYFPIFAHPERYSYLRQREEYKLLKSNDVQFQLNLSSLHGLYGKTEKEKAEWLLENDMYNYYGTDCHTVHHIADTKLPLSEFEFKKSLLPHLEKLIEKAY